MTYSITKSSAENLFRLLSDATGGRPPACVFHVLLSLIGSPDALNAAICDRQSSAETGTRWVTLGTTASCLVYVAVKSADPDWDAGSDMRTPHDIEAAWIRPLADVRQVRVLDLESWHQGFSTEWHWKPRFGLVLDGGDTIPVPDFDKSTFPEKRDAGQAFMDGLLALLDR